MTQEKLQYLIDSTFNPQGFDKLNKNINKTKKESKGFSSILNSSLGRMATGYLTLTGLTSQYNKMVEASNYQLEQETKLYATMQGQGFREEQIDNIKKYASALQEVGVVGDEVTLAGVQQLATYNLTEESLKKLMPAMQDMLVQQKGLNGTGQDAVGVANTLAKGLLGQTGRLEQVGISLTDYQKQLIATGNEEQKVAALVEAVTMNVGEQNKEFLKLPEGRIVSAKNRVGDVYEYWGGLMRETRADAWQLFADNEGVFTDFIGGIIKAGTRFADTSLKTIQTMKKGFNVLGDDAKKTMGLIAGGLVAVKFPMVALGLVIEDVFAAFQGKQAFTEDATNALLEFAGTDYKFSDLRKDVGDFWKEFTDPAAEATDEISNVNFVLQNTIDLFKTGLEVAEMGVGLMGMTTALPNYLKDLVTSGFDVDYANDNFQDSFGMQHLKGGYNKLDATTKHMANNFDRVENYNNNERYREVEENQFEQGSKEAEIMKVILGADSNLSAGPVDNSTFNNNTSNTSNIFNDNTSNNSNIFNDNTSNNLNNTKQEFYQQTEERAQRNKALKEKVVEKTSNNQKLNFTFNNNFTVNETTNAKETAQQTVEQIEKIMKESLNGEYLRVGGAASGY